MRYQTLVVGTARELEDLLNKLHNVKDDWVREVVTITHAIASYSMGYHENTYTLVIRLHEKAKSCTSTGPR